MCNICPEICPGMNFNSCNGKGTVDSSCTCVCDQGFYGASCMDTSPITTTTFDLSKCPAVDPYPCGTEWPKSYCTKYSNVPEKCLILCDICPDICPGMKYDSCGDHGSVDSSCGCLCKSGFHGPTCEFYDVCPKEADEWYCSTFPAEYCDQYSNVPVNCPFKCKRCK